MEAADSRANPTRHVRFKQRKLPCLLATQIDKKSEGDQLPFVMVRH